MELKNRYDTIRNSDKDTCLVSKLNNIPVTIYMDDIRNNSQNWRNKGYQVFFNKKMIIVKD